MFNVLYPSYTSWSAIEHSVMLIILIMLGLMCAVIAGFLSPRFTVPTPFRRMKSFNEKACAKSAIMGPSSTPLIPFRARANERPVLFFYIYRNAFIELTLRLQDSLTCISICSTMWESNQIPLRKPWLSYQNTRLWRTHMQIQLRAEIKK